MSEQNTASRSVMWGLVALAAALLIAGLSVGRGIREIRAGSTDITVTGSAKRPIRADFAVWRPELSTQDLSISQAMRQVQESSERVLAFLKTQGVPDSAIVLRPVSTYTIRPYNSSGEATNRPPSYNVTQSFEIRLADVDKMTSLAREVNALAAEGIPLTGPSPEYLFMGLADLRIAMLGEATKDAQVRAQEIASSVGVKLGKVRNVRLGVFQITPRNSTEVSDMGFNDVSSIDKDITSVVRVTFALD